MDKNVRVGWQGAEGPTCSNFVLSSNYSIIIILNKHRATESSPCTNHIMPTNLSKDYSEFPPKPFAPARIYSWPGVVIVAILPLGADSGTI